MYLRVLHYRFSYFTKGDLYQYLVAIITRREWTRSLAKRVADIIVDSLITSGVRRVYGVSGDSLNGITDAVRDRGKEKISWIPVRHEETAAFAAGAEAHLTRELAVCAGSCGPGNTHLINGLYDCYRSRVPVLAIAAHIPSREIGSSYIFKKHIRNSCSKNAVTIASLPHMQTKFRAFSILQ